MFAKMIGRLLGRPSLPQDLSYEKARGALETRSLDLRRELSSRTDVEPEILYYLAGDDNVAVRRNVAANPTTPQHANRLLADDRDDEVRCELAAKIARIVPDLDPNEADRVRDLAIDVLEKLAADHLPRVRQIVAEEIKHSNRVPREVVQRLARDVESIVAAPVLEYSPLLSDQDLIEIVASGAASGALQAVARRRNVSAPVSDAVVATLDIPAVAALLVNPSAQIREEALDRIIENAEGIEDWHRPLVVRSDLSLRAVRRIAGFVALALLEILEQRTGLDTQTSAEIKKRVRERIQAEDLSEDSAQRTTQAKERVAQALRAGHLDDEFVASAIEANDRTGVVHALAELAKVAPFAVERVLAARNGKGATALAWKAGLQMRTALKLQTLMLKLPAHEIVPARNGVDFPLTPDEMNWHLGYFGIAD